MYTIVLLLSSRINLPSSPISTISTISTTPLTPPFPPPQYLVPADLTVGQFQYVIRKRIKLEPSKALFIFVNSSTPPTSSLMSTVYEESRDEDGFLYVQYSGESTFGACVEEGVLVEVE